MKKTILSLLCLLSLVAASCADDGGVEPEPKPTPEPAIASHTVVVYIMGENSLSGFVNNDLSEMVRAKADVPRDANLVVYVDDRNPPTIYQITASEGCTPWREYKDDPISTDSLFMLTTLREITHAFPAQEYSYVFWSHGSGWVPQVTRSIGIDNGENNGSNGGLQMNIPTLRGVLENLPHPTFILFDACAMQSVEVAYELRHVCKYILGSPAEIPGEGAPYDKILRPLMHKDWQGVAEQYFKHYEHGDGVILSLVDCGKLEALAQATAATLPQLYDYTLMYGDDRIQYYMPYSHQSRFNPEAFDIESAMHAALNDESFAQWHTALSQAIAYRNSTDTWATSYSNTGYGYGHSRLYTRNHYAALSMFIPLKKYTAQGWCQHFKTMQWYKDAGWQAFGWPE